MRLRWSKVEKARDYIDISVVWEEKQAFNRKGHVRGCPSASR